MEGVGDRCLWCCSVLKTTPGPEFRSTMLHFESMPGSVNLWGLQSLLRLMENETSNPPAVHLRLCRSSPTRATRGLKNWIYQTLTVEGCPNNNLAGCLHRTWYQCDAITVHAFHLLRSVQRKARVSTQSWNAKGRRIKDHNLWWGRLPARSKKFWHAHQPVISLISFVTWEAWNSCIIYIIYPMILSPHSHYIDIMLVKCHISWHSGLQSARSVSGHCKNTQACVADQTIESNRKQLQHSSKSM